MIFVKAYGLFLRVVKSGFKYLLIDCFEIDCLIFPGNWFQLLQRQYAVVYVNNSAWNPKPRWFKYLTKFDA